MEIRKVGRYWYAFGEKWIRFFRCSYCGFGFGVMGGKVIVERGYNSYRIRWTRKFCLCWTGLKKKDDGENETD